MYIIYINGGYKGTHNLEDILLILKNTGYFDVNVAKPSGFTSSASLIHNLTNLKLGQGEYLDSKHKWKITKVS